MIARRLILGAALVGMAFSLPACVVAAASGALAAVAPAALVAAGGTRLAMDATRTAPDGEQVSP